MDSRSSDSKPAPGPQPDGGFVIDDSPDDVSERERSLRQKEYDDWVQDQIAKPPQKLPETDPREG